MVHHQILVIQASNIDHLCRRKNMIVTIGKECKLDQDVIDNNVLTEKQNE